MCTYCMVGDFHFKYDPPFPAPSPLVPIPIAPGPFTPWPLEKLVELHDLLKRIKALEDQLGCPCEPNKADYIGMLEERIKKLEERAARKAKAKPAGVA